MRYQIVELEVTRPIPAIQLGPDDSGVALVVRRKGRPVGFEMRNLSPGATLGAEEVSRLLGPRVQDELLAASVRESLAAPGASPPFPSLTVAICTKDNPDLLMLCLRALHEVAPQAPAGANGAAGAPGFEILVVDNNSSSGRTREVAESFPGVRYVHEPLTGLDFARNRALCEARGELLAFIDDDATVDRDWLAGLIEAWCENPDAGAFTGPVLPVELETRSQILFEERLRDGHGFEKRRYGRVLPGNPLYPCGPGLLGTGANMAFSVRVLNDLGGFDEALDTGRPLPGGGDIDMFYRVIRAGYPLAYEPRFLVFHKHRRTLATLRRQYWSWGLGLMAFIAKSFQSDPGNRKKLALMVGWWFQDQFKMLVRALLGRHSLPPGMVLAEIWGGVTGICGEYGRSRARSELIRKRYERNVRD